MINLNIDKDFQDNDEAALYLRETADSIEEGNLSGEGYDIEDRGEGDEDDEE